MLRPYGRDRLESPDALRPVLVSPLSKGWRARTPASRTRPEHPGTAVGWDGLHFEVVDMDGNRIDKVLVTPRHAPVG